VVFFGENVPRPKVEDAMAAVASADGLLAVGTSLMVYSGPFLDATFATDCRKLAFRFVRAADQASIPFAIVNIGPTRADDLTDLKVAARSGQLLPRLSTRLSRRLYGNAHTV
jgi:NAD-dependent SIR2 family protein deacetylase